MPRPSRSTGEHWPSVSNNWGQTIPTQRLSLHNLALLYEAQGKYAEAKPLYQRALAICEQALGPDHPNTKIVRQNYALFLQHFSPGEEKK